MRLLFCSEHRLTKSNDGRYWVNSSLDRALRRYMSEGVDVTALLRVAVVPGESSESVPLPSSIHVVELPNFRGLAGLVRSFAIVRRSARCCVAGADRVVVRVPGAIGARVSKEAHRLGRPVLAELVGDPHDVFSSDASEVPLRALVRWVATRQLQKVAREADVTCYVTAEHLQTRYPPALNSPSFAISDVELSERQVLDVPRQPPEVPFRVVSIATMDQPYKRVDLLLAAMQLLQALGLPTQLVVIGDGVLRSRYESLARDMSVSCEFTGQLNRKQVLETLDQSDVYLSTSYQEGLPRALVEAMARGLPTFAFDVGGTRELTPGTQVWPRGQLEPLVSQMAATLQDRRIYRAASEQAIETARRYTEDVLDHQVQLLLAAFLGE
jgi:glycosyltransferase involved in cell wall biosynthesis